MAENKSAQQLAKVCAEVKAIGKTKTNTQGPGFKYRGVDDFMNSIGPIFRSHGLTLTIDQFLCELSYTQKENQYGKSVEWTRAKLGTHYVAVADDGSSTKIATVYSEGLDNSDKAIPKAMSMALKNMLSQVFLVPTEDTHDPDAETPEIESHRKTAPTPVSQVRQPQQQGPTETEIKRLFALAKQKLIQTSDIQEFMALEFGIKTTKEMTRTQFDALGIVIENNQFTQILQGLRDRKTVT